MQNNNRDSSIELYRIVTMLAIVFGHYVFNSGLREYVTGFNGFLLLGLGGWGKVGINCFVLITGYYMCTSRITVRKFLKLFLEFLFYKYVIGIVFFAFGYEPMTIRSLVKMLCPIMTLKDNFTGCFLVFFLTIPFLNVLVNNLTKRQHQHLILLCVGFFSLLPTFPLTQVTLKRLRA